MIIFRYLAREVLISMVAVSGVLLLIIMSSRFVRYLADAASGKLAPDILFAVIGYRMPGFLELILPLGLFIAFLLAYGRLYMDSEMTVLSACGFSPSRLMAYSLVPAGLVAIFVAALSLFVSPLGIEKADTILKAQKQRSEFEHLSPMRFLELDAGNGVIYAESLSENRKIMNRVFLAEMVGQSRTRSGLAVISAEQAEQVVDAKTGQRYMKLTQGHRYNGHPGTPEYDVLTFESYLEWLPQDNTAPVRSGRSDSQTTFQLMASDKIEDIAALHWRFSLPVLVLVVTLLAVPLSRTNPRQGRYAQMIPAILLYIIYLVSLNGARGAMEDKSISPWLSIWAVHGVALMIALLLWLWPSVRNKLRERKQRGLAHA